MADIDSYVATQNAKDQLRFITCGSVDDGKSTLLGRMLFDSKSVFEDQLAATTGESQKYGTQGDAVDLALLVDGLQAEREQGITIDVAYRFFESEQRKFIAADTPGHEQYTRNMATGASTADLAVILVDARHGVITQTRRHAFIAHLLGIRHFVLAVNKMDLVDYAEATYAAIVDEFSSFMAGLGAADIRPIPVSALNGANVFSASNTMPWYDGPTLMGWLDMVQVSTAQPASAAFRMPVQWVNRPASDFRGFSGMIAGGAVAVGDNVTAALSGRSAKIARIYGPDGDIEQAESGTSVTLVLDTEIDISRGDMIADTDDGCEVADQLAAHIIWMDADDMLPEREYLVRFATAEASAQISDLTYQIDVNSLEHLAAKTLPMNGVAYCKISLDRAIAFDAYESNRQTGSFILIDKYTNATVGAGMVSFGLRRASNIEWHDMQIDKQTRAASSGQKPCLLWFTGLSGSGKSTIADRLEQKLFRRGKRTYLLDGDNVRHGLNKDLGFTDEDRVENVRRVAEVGKLMVDAGLIVLASFISPFRSERDMARGLLEEGEFVEIFVDTPLEICESRDPKGLYKKARSGELKNFTGIDSAYETPEAAELVLKSGETDVDQLADSIIAYLERNGFMD